MDKIEKKVKFRNILDDANEKAQSFQGLDINSEERSNKYDKYVDGQIIL